MKSFLEFIKEEKEIVLYHGVHKKHIPSFLRKGILPGHDDGRGAVFLTPRADVAFGYAAMGGEGQFLAAASKGTPKVVPTEDRAVFKFKIPESWYKENLVRERGGSAPEVSFKKGIPPEFIHSYEVGSNFKKYL